MRSFQSRLGQTLSFLSSEFETSTHGARLSEKLMRDLDDSQKERRGSGRPFSGLFSSETPLSSTLSCLQLEEARHGLEQKHFTIESDRAVVRELLSDFAVKRRFVRAIRNCDEEEVKTLLAGLQSYRLDALIESTVDHVLNTPLHLAVSFGCSGVVRLLLEHGADPARRNLRGDTPSQFFLWPRLTLAARLSRQEPTLKASISLGIRGLTAADGCSTRSAETGPSQATTTPHVGGIEAEAESMESIPGGPGEVQRPKQSNCTGVNESDVWTAI